MIEQISCYIRKAFEADTNWLIATAGANIPVDEPDTLIGTGLSGALVVPILGRALGMNWAIVRKDNDSNHATHRIEGRIGERWAFVDDQVASGATLRRVKDAMNALTERHSLADLRYVGAYLYLDGQWCKPGNEGY